MLDDAIRHDDNTIGHDQRFFLIVGDVDDRDAEAILDLHELDLHVLAQLLVERAERLVHEQQRRPEHDGARERDALLLPAAELRRIAVAQIARA